MSKRIIIRDARAQPSRLRATPCLIFKNVLAAMAGGVVLASLTGPVPTHAEEDKLGTPTWQSVLALQLKDEYRCDLDKVLFDRDVEAGGKVAKEGRARCLDGREFDFSRPSTHEKFNIHLCQPTVC